ncbi:MAG: hypothetical protein AAF517_17070 [Planctomycetota bacterium]
MRRASLLQALFLSVALSACGETPRPVETPKSDDEDSTVTLDRIPYSIRAEPVVSRVRGRPETETETNTAYALFDLNRHTLMTLLATKEDWSKGSSEVATVGTERVDTQDQLVARADTDARGRDDESEDLGKKQGIEETARSRDDQTARRGSTAESDEGGRDDASEGTETATTTTTRDRSESSVDRGSTERLLTQSEVISLVQQSSELFRERGGHYTDLIEQDRFLKLFFSLTKAQIREYLDKETLKVQKELFKFTKSISVEEVVPGETFTYTIRFENHSKAPVRSVTFYDEFPRGQLLFEYGRSQGVRIDRQGKEHRIDGRLIYATPNEWEDGKLAWVIAKELGPGESLSFYFQATWFAEEGSAKESVAVRTEASADSAAVGNASPKDLVLVAERTPDAEFLPVSVRAQGSGRELKGFIPASAFTPARELDATDREKTLQQTVYFGWSEKDDASS